MQMLTQLPSEPVRLTNFGLGQLTRDPNSGCILDFIKKGLPLLLTFGFAEWKGLARFDFWERSKKYEKKNNAPFNRLLLRDTSSIWYQHGCPGIGEDSSDINNFLLRAIKLLKPPFILCMGQSMGGYAAIQFGVELAKAHNNVKIISFGPQSTLDPDCAKSIGDTRFIPAMELIKETKPKGSIVDLPSHIIRATEEGAKLDIEIVMGTSSKTDSTENPDIGHLQRFTNLPGVRTEAHPKAAHDILVWLKETGQLDSRLQKAFDHLKGHRLERSWRQALRVLSKEKKRITPIDILRIRKRNFLDCSSGLILINQETSSKADINEDEMNWLTECLILGFDWWGLNSTLIKSGKSASKTRSIINEILNKQETRIVHRLIEAGRLIAPERADGKMG